MKAAALAVALLAGCASLTPGLSSLADVEAAMGRAADERLDFPRMNRETWSWHMRQFGHLPVGLHVQMSPDGVVREVYVLDENNKGESRGVEFGL